MSDFLKKAAGILFNVEDEGDGTTPKKQSSEQSSSGDPQPQQNSFNTVPDSKAAEKFNEYFKKLYTQANLPGPDFYEFSNMIDAMGNLIADEIKYPSVYAGFSGQLTKEKLISSADEYLRIMEQDKADFEKSLQNAQKTKVHDRKMQIEKKAQQIKDLQEQIGKLNFEIAELNKLSEQDAARLTSENAAYFQQSELIRARIKSGKDKVIQYIK